jgi:2-polyprenyl-3-methyl-5-hydroxy-6-metoxy-1,4-benzoquinol methylase
MRDRRLECAPSSSDNSPVEDKIFKIFVKWLQSGGVKNPNILDLGCGIGNYARKLAASGFRVTAVDIDLSSLKHLRGLDKTNSINALCADVSTRIVKNGVQYDIVVATEILEHIHEPEIVLHNIHTMLKTGGNAYISIPNGYGP